MTRRRFLTILFAFISSLYVFLISQRRFRDYKQPRLDTISPTGLLSQQEMQTVLVLAEALVPDSAMAKLDSQFFVEHVNHRTLNRKGYLKAYREGVALLDETTRRIFGKGKRFSVLTLSEREAVLDSMLWKYRADQVIKIRLMQIFSPKRNLAFREFVVKDILQAVSRSPALWAVVGYSHYPGVPAVDLFEYTMPIDAANP